MIGKKLIIPSSHWLKMSFLFSLQLLHIIRLIYIQKAGNRRPIITVSAGIDCISKAGRVFLGFNGQFMVREGQP